MKPTRQQTEDTIAGFRLSLAECLVWLAAGFLAGAVTFSLLLL